MIRNIVCELSQMSLAKEPGQDVDTFGSQVIEKTGRIVRSRSYSSNINSIIAQYFIEFDVLAFKFKTLQFYDIVYDNPTGM